MKSIAIGIDLGTSYSCMGVWRNERVEIIPNDQGNRLSPSFVAFTEEGCLVGEAAQSQIAMNPRNTVYDAMRFVGRKFEDPAVQLDMREWMFDVVSADGTKPLVEVQLRGEARTFQPEEILSIELSRMKRDAERYLGSAVEHAVIAVPAYFNLTQRQAIKDAGTIAGLKVLRVISEPTAAGMAFSLSNKLDGEKNVLIFDLGGGTFDASLLSLDNGLVEVKATAGDTDLGGEDFDTRMVEFCIEDFKRKHGTDLSETPRALIRLRRACEQAKRTLSSAIETTIEVESLHDGIDFSLPFTRSYFEELTADLQERIVPIIEKVVFDSKVDPATIDEVVMVGGSSRIPRIQQIVQEIFRGKTLNHSINADEAVATGAALQAAIMSGVPSRSVDSILLLDVASHSVGVEVAGGFMARMILRNCAVPCKKTHIFSTFADNQSSALIKVYEGDNELTAENNLLGTMKIDNIPLAPRGVAQIEVTFDLDANEHLVVTAEDKTALYDPEATEKSDCLEIGAFAEKTHEDHPQLKPRESKSATDQVRLAVPGTRLPSAAEVDRIKQAIQEMLIV